MIESRAGRGFKIFIYFVCVLIAITCILPFWIMFINATRGTFEIQQRGIALLPSDQLRNNLSILQGKSFYARIGLMNSMIISTGATVCATYFSALTAYALVAYEWKLRQPFFIFILAVMMIPAQVVTIGFYQFMYRIGMTNSLWPLILPAIASPAVVFFMRQYLFASLSLEIVDSARIDGAVYLALALSVLPLFVIYFALSKYIIAGVQVGGIKE